MDTPKQQPASSTSSSRSGSPSGSNNKTQVPSGIVWLLFLALLLLNYFFTKIFFPGPVEPVKIPYTLFKEEVVKNNVKAVYTKGEIISGKFIQAVNYLP